MKAIIFDLDGVLLSTDHYHYLAWKELADSLKIPFDETVNMQLRGVSRMDSLLIVLGDRAGEYSQAVLQEMCETKNTRYREYLKQLTPAVLDGNLHAVLDGFRDAGIKMAIGSSSKNTLFILERVGLANAFDAIVDGNDIRHSKPHPEVFLKAADKLGFAPDACVVIEDAQAGIDAAKAAGMAAVAFGPYAKNLTGADCFAGSITQLPTVLHPYFS